MAHRWADLSRDRARSRGRICGLGPGISRSCRKPVHRRSPGSDRSVARQILTAGKRRLVARSPCRWSAVFRWKPGYGVRGGARSQPNKRAQWCCDVSPTSWLLPRWALERPDWRGATCFPPWSRTFGPISARISPRSSSVTLAWRFSDWGPTPVSPIGAAWSGCTAPSCSNPRALSSGRLPLSPYWR